MEDEEPHCMSAFYFGTKPMAFGPMMGSLPLWAGFDTLGREVVGDDGDTDVELENGGGKTIGRKKTPLTSTRRSNNMFTFPPDDEIELMHTIPKVTLERDAATGQYRPKRWDYERLVRYLHIQKWLDSERDEMPGPAPYTAL